jgi:hypothetical protein
MPSEDTTSTLGVVLSHSKIDLPLFGQYVGTDMVIAKKRCDGNWLYVLKCEACRTFYEFEASINALDFRLRVSSDKKKNRDNNNNNNDDASSSSSSYFIPVLDTSAASVDIVLIGALGTPLLEEVFDETTGQVRQPVEIWQMTSTVPPRKRVKKTDDSFVIPMGLMMKLSRQLHVDFSVNVYGDGGKRRREQVSSVYRGGGGGDSMMTIKKKGNEPKKTRTKTKKTSTASSAEDTSAAVRDYMKPYEDINNSSSSSTTNINNNKTEEENEFNIPGNKQQQQKNLHIDHPLATVDSSSSSSSSSSADDDNDGGDNNNNNNDDDDNTMLLLSSRMLESISTAHAEALAAKKEIIRIMAESHTAVINAKNKVIHTQAALIEELLEKKKYNR